MFRVALFAGVLLFAVMQLDVSASDSAVEVARIEAATWSYVVFALSVTTVKIVALTLGYFIAKLGYSTMMAGVQGDDSVELKAFGSSIHFKGVTPGLALGLVGILMMGWALSTKHQFTTQVSRTATELREEADNEKTNNPPEVSQDAEDKPVPPKL